MKFWKVIQTIINNTRRNIGRDIFQLRKTQEQLKDYAVEIDKKMRKKHIKKKDEEENFLIDECSCINACHSCY